METTKEKPLTLKSLQNHIIISIVGSVILAVGSSFITANAFYWNTTHDVVDLKQISQENTENIKAVNEAVITLTNKVESMNTPTTVNSVEIKNISERLGKVENSIDKLSDKIDKVLLK